MDNSPHPSVVSQTLGYAALAAALMACFAVVALGGPPARAPGIMAQPQAAAGMVASQDFEAIQADPALKSTLTSATQ